MISKNYVVTHDLYNVMDYDLDMTFSNSILVQFLEKRLPGSEISKENGTERCHFEDKNSDIFLGWIFN